MRTRVIILILVNVILVAATFFLVRTWLSDQETVVSEVEAPVETPQVVQILVASDDLGPGLLMLKQHWQWQPWPTDSLSESYISYLPEEEPEEALEQKEEELVGSVVRYGIPAGQPLVMGAIVKPGEAGFLAAILEKGYRAVSIPVTAASSSAGLVLPGDRVDVILTHDVQVEDSEGKDYDHQVSVTLMTNIRVLALDQRLSQDEDDANVGRTATLQVTPKQAESLTLGVSMGQLSMSLLGVDDLDSPMSRRRTTTWDFQASTAISPPGAKAEDTEQPTMFRGGDQKK